MSAVAVEAQLLLVHGEGMRRSLATGTASAQVLTRRAPAVVIAAMRASRSESQAALVGTDGPSLAPDPTVVVVVKVTARGPGRDPSIPDYEVCHLTLSQQASGWRVSTFAIQP